MKIIGARRKVVGADFVRITDLRFVDGRPEFQSIEGSGFSLKVDTVIFATGQKPDTALLGTESGVACTVNGTIASDPETMMTSRRGVFAAGDATSGPSSVIDAIASGQKAAFYIDRYLQGEVLRVRPGPQLKESDIKIQIPVTTQKQSRESTSVLPVSERFRGFREVVGGFTEARAIAEAQRCLNCAGHLCKDACPYHSPQFADEEKSRMQKCDLCLDRLQKGKQTICVESCPLYALDAGPLEELKRKYAGGSSAYGLPPTDGLKPSVVFKAKVRG
jgi:NADPH-dependent glutamate synthase beta subunit-like oxidoreductase